MFTMVIRYHDQKLHMEESLFGRRVPKEESIRQERHDSQEAATETVAGTGGAKKCRDRLLEVRQGSKLSKPTSDFLPPARRHLQKVP